jgi:hypothetical protein
MKTKEELKEELHKMIDSIEDESALNILKEDVVPYIINHRGQNDFADDLSLEEELRLKQAIEQSENGETVTMEEFKEATKRWRK